MSSFVDWLGNNAVVNGIHKGVDVLSGSPDELKDSYDKQIAAAKANGEDVKNFLLGQQQKSEGYYKPLQDMFASAYGTGGIQAPEVPTAPGKPLAAMYGGGK